MFFRSLCSNSVFVQVTVGHFLFVQTFWFVTDRPIYREDVATWRSE